MNCRLEIHTRDCSRSVLEKELDKANELLSKEGDSLIDMVELSRLSDEIYYNPSRSIDIIKLLRECQEPQLGN